MEIPASRSLTGAAVAAPEPLRSSRSPIYGRVTAGWVVLVSAVGILAWVLLWTGLTPHAHWDTLMYHKIAAGYAGLSDSAQDAYAWASFADHAEPGYREALQAKGLWPWDGWSEVHRERWVDQYRMRPLYPYTVAILYPLFGVAAPPVVGLLATLGFTLAAGIGLAPFVGRFAALMVACLALATPNFSRWLVFLQTDGLALALFMTVLITIALYVVRGDRASLAGFGLSAMALTLARPLGAIVPIIVGLCVLVALLRRDRIWRRFAAAISISMLPVAAFLAFSRVMDFPSFEDLLQDLPTRHFSLPDVSDPWSYIWRSLLWQTGTDLLPGLAQNTFLWLALALSAVGYYLARPGWWALPFLMAIPGVAVTYVLHPGLSEFPRTMAPAWVSIYLGVAMLALVLRSERSRFASRLLRLRPAEEVKG